MAGVDMAGVDMAGVDMANNAKLLRELEAVGEAERAARFVCVISAARDGREVAHFRGEATGVILRESRGGWASATTRCFAFLRWARALPNSHRWKRLG